MNFDEAKQELINAAEKHPLYDTLKSVNGIIVIGRGSTTTNPEYLFIGEAPGFQEIKVGKAFVGESGDVLNKWIKTCNIKSYAIINAIPLILLDSNGKIRKPTKEEMSYFKPYVDNLIKALNPKNIICVGKSSSECLQQDFRLKKWNDNVGFVYHPSFYLSSGRSGVQDFVDLVNNKPLITKLQSKTLVDSEVKFQEFFNEIINSKIIVFDTETTALSIQELKLVGLSFSNGIKSWYIPVGHNTTESQLNFDSIKDHISFLLNNRNLVIGHNLVFDMQVLRKYDIYPENTKWFDTMVAQHLIDENDRKGLKYLVKKYFNYDMKTFGQVSKSYNISYSPINDVCNYACDDAIQTWNLYELLSDKILYFDLENLFYNIEMPFLKCIIEMEWNGILIDTDKLSELNKLVNEKIKQTEKELASHLPSKYKMKNLLDEEIISINLNSSQQLINLLYGALKLSIKSKNKRTETPSVDTPTLKMIKKEHPIISPLIKYKEYQKLLSAFINALPEHICEDGRVHCKFNDTGTRTGRLSSSDINIQQLPNSDEINIRSCFISSPDHKLVVFDYSQEELRLAAFLSKEESMVKAYNEGLDLHLLTANKIFDLKLSNEELKSGTESYKQAKSKYYNERNNAKAIVFGILYGMTEYNLSDRLSISIDKAKKMIKDYFKSFPKIKECIDKTHDEVEKKGFVRNYYGRYRHFTKNSEGKYPSTAFRQSFNFRIQGFAADVLRIAMSNVRKFLKENGDESKLLFTVHDEMCLEVPDNKVGFYSENIKRIMEEALIINPPLISEGGSGNDYSEAK